MQWRRKRRILYVIGSAHHALLIRHYRESRSDLCRCDVELTVFKTFHCYSKSVLLNLDSAEP